MGRLALSFEQHGAVRIECAALPAIGGLETALARIGRERPGLRLCGLPGLSDLLAADATLGGLAVAQIGPGARPVRAVLFDKTPRTNWSLGWHQDRTVAVRARHELSGWGPWSVKTGLQHVEPPFALIEGMVTLRIHLDPVPAGNAPLLIAPGSHRLGRVTERNIDTAVRRCGTVACLAERGDVWVYATPILHASAASDGHARRRVLQVDYAASELPEPLEWLGI